MDGETRLELAGRGYRLAAHTPNLWIEDGSHRHRILIGWAATGDSCRLCFGLQSRALRTRSLILRLPAWRPALPA